MKIALVQQKATADKSANLKRGLENAVNAIEAGAKVISFAELAFELFYPRVPATEGFADLAEPIPGPIPGPITDAWRIPLHLDRTAVTFREQTRNEKSCPKAAF